MYETTYKTEDKIHAIGNDNPLQAAVEHFPELSPPVLGYLWFAFQPDCSTDTLPRMSIRREAAPPETATASGIPHQPSPQGTTGAPSRCGAPDELQVTLDPGSSSRGGLVQLNTWSRWLCSGLRHWVSSHSVRPVQNSYITSSRCLQVPTGSEIRLW